MLSAQVRALKTKLDKQCSIYDRRLPEQRALRSHFSKVSVEQFRLAFVFLNIYQIHVRQTLIIPSKLLVYRALSSLVSRIQVVLNA